MSAETRIQDALREIETGHRIRILFAAESGSRAWGHASPDSDYDVRFVYARPLPAYLTVGKRSDFLELGLVGDLDLAGWDVDKAIRLLISGNPTILEWLTSPITYRAGEHRHLLEALADLAPHRRAAHWHYRSLARRQRELLGCDGPVKLKRYFYVIRPALAVAWLRQCRENLARVPMTLDELLKRVDVPDVVRRRIVELRAKKALASEMGTGPRIPEIDEFVAAVLDGEQEPPLSEPGPKLVTLADSYLHRIIGAPSA